MTSSALPFRRLSHHIAALSAAAVLAACGGDGPSTPTLSGTAATGAPIAGGTVEIRCAGGAPLSATTATDGRWQVGISGQTLPCALRVSGGSAGGSALTVDYHALALSFDGNVNLTPLSDLVVARTVGASPAAWFATPDFKGIDNAAVAQALDAVKTALALGGALGDKDPLYVRFEPQAGDTIDDLLEKLQKALASLSLDYAALLAAAGSGDFSAFGSLPAAIAAATVDGTGGGGSCSGGAVATVFEAAGSGGPYTNGQTVCVTASATSLTVDGKTLLNPVQNTAVSAPYSAYSFADGNLVYELVLQSGALYELNLNAGTSYLGRLRTAQAGGTGSGTLSVDIAINGQPTASFDVAGVSAPASQAEFCDGADSQSVLSDLQSQAGVTLSITSCSYANNVGTVRATATVGGVSVPYVVSFRFLP